jgi:hypothetical protein
VDHPTPNVNGSQLEETFCDLVGDNFLQQFITGPTHVRGNILNLLLCNCPEIIKNVMTWSPDQSNFPSDHYIVEFEIQQACHRANAVTWNVSDYKRGSFDELTILLRLFHRTISMNVGCSGKIGFYRHLINLIPVKNVKDANRWRSDTFHTKEILCPKEISQMSHRLSQWKLREISQTIKYLVKRKHRDHLLETTRGFPSSINPNSRDRLYKTLNHFFNHYFVVK